MVDARVLRAAALCAFLAVACGAEPDVQADPAFIVRITEPTQGASLESRSLEAIRGDGFDAVVELAEVQIAIARVRGVDCRWYVGPDRPRFQADPSGCSQAEWSVAERADGRWAYPLDEPLPPGNYRVLVRGKDDQGNVGASDGIVFRLTR